MSESTRSTPDPGVLEWLRAQQRHLAVDPVILGEIRYGILRLPPSRRRAALEEWFSGLVSRIACIPWERDTGLRWAELLADLERAGRTIPTKDSLIAATALTHGLTVVTRNVTDFRTTGVPVLNPFEA